MKRKYNIMLIFLFPLLMLLMGCVDEEQNIPPPPPQLFDGHLCDTFKERSRQRLREEGIRLVFDDTFKEAGKRHILDSILEHQYQLSSVRIFDSNYTNCIQPIMDSAIVEKYGINGKDSIINEAYRLTDIVHKKENKE